MTRKLSMFFLLVLFSQVFLLAQQKMILRPDNTLEKVTQVYDGHETMMVPPSKHQVQNHAIQTHHISKSVNGTIDTLNYNDGSWNTNFGAFGQDWLMQWYVCPADLTIKQVGYSTTDASSPNVEIKIVKVLWTKAQLAAAGEKNQGYYTATGNGYNDITAFPTNPDANGGWVAVNSGVASPFDVADVWSDAGVGAPSTAVKQNALGYQWVPMNLIAEPKLLAGDIFGIAIKNTNTNLTSAAAADRFGVYAGASTTLNGWKYYANGRTVTGTSGDKGWWSRAYSWDLVAEVELTGDVAPTIVSFDKLPTTLSTSARTVNAVITDVNPSGGAAGVKSATIKYTIDKGVTWNDVAMTGTGDNYAGDIPGQAKGTAVQYKIVAVDVNDNATESLPVDYIIFAPNPLNPTLVVFNGFAKTTGYPPSYYFAYNGATANASEVIAFPKDKWSYGKLTKELVDNYRNIVEITTTGPKAVNDAVIKEWLAGAPNRNYLLAGDEYLGYQSNWTNKTYAAGDFQFDVLGVAKDYNDVSYAAAGDEKKASLASGVAGTTLGDSLALKVVALAEDSLKIDPTYELGSTYSNWLDGFEVVDGTVVDVKAVGKDGATYNVGAHRTLAAGNKIAFLAYDPLSLDSPESAYFWYGFDRVSPLVQAMNWFDAWTPNSLNTTVEFKCNMSVQMKRGTFKATDSVWVRGNFNDWAGKATQLTDPDGDSVYTGVFSTFTTGQSLVFKYVHSPDVWESTGNRTLTVAAGANVTSACWEDVCVYIPVKTIKVAFSVNMELERLSGLFNPASNNVSVRGSFNGWGETAMTPSATNADLYEVVADVIAAKDEKVSFKFFYSPGTWEVNNLDGPSQNDRFFIVDQATYDAGTKEYAAVGFNNGSLETVLNQDAYITFAVNTNGASIVNAPQGTAFTTVHMAGGNSPLQWPGGGWPDADITKVIQLFDDGTHNDAVAGDKIFTTEVKFPKYATLNVVYKYGANWGLPTNGGANDNEAGVGADKTLKMHKFSAKETVVDTFGIVHTTVLKDPTKVEKLDEIPTVFALAQNYPNPFNPETSIRFSVPQESFVTVKVFNTLGEEVMTLVNEEKTAGTYNVSFNAKNLTSGIYFYTIKANDFTSTKKMILMK